MAFSGVHGVGNPSVGFHARVCKLHSGDLQKQAARSLGEVSLQPQQDCGCHCFMTCEWLKVGPSMVQRTCRAVRSAIAGGALACRGHNSKKAVRPVLTKV